MTRAKCWKCGSTHDVTPRATDDKLECWDCWVKRENAAMKREATRAAKRAAALKPGQSKDYGSHVEVMGPR